MQESDADARAVEMLCCEPDQRNFRIAVADDGSELCQTMRQWLSQAEYDYCRLPIVDGILAPSNHLGIDLLALNYQSKLRDIELAIERIRNEPGAESLLLLLVNIPEHTRLIDQSFAMAIDDFIIAPVRSAEFFARLYLNLQKAIIPRSAVKFLEFGRYTVDPVARQVSLDGHLIRLTPKETDLAMFLFHRIVRLSSHDHILSSVWGISPSVNTRTVSTYISRIRKRLHLDEDNGLKLTAVYHRGYRLDMVN